MKKIINTLAIAAIVCASYAQASILFGTLNCGASGPSVPGDAVFDNPNTEWCEVIVDDHDRGVIPQEELQFAKDSNGNYKFAADYALGKANVTYMIPIHMYADDAMAVEIKPTAPNAQGPVTVMIKKMTVVSDYKTIVVENVPITVDGSSTMVELNGYLGGEVYMVEIEFEALSPSETATIGIDSISLWSLSNEWEW